MEIKGKLLGGRVYDKKDGSGKGLMINVLVDARDLTTSKVVNLFSGDAFVGAYDLTSFKIFDDVIIEYTQEFGSQYTKLVNIHKVK